MSETQVLDMDITKSPSDTPTVIVEDNGSEEMIDVSGEGATTSDETSESVSEDTTPSETKTQKNKSNFKKLAKSSREKDKRIAELEAKLAQESTDNDFEEEEDSDSDDITYDRVDLLEFITDTPGAGEMKNQIKETLDEFPGISFEKAFSYAKAQLPQESQSHQLFNTKSSSAPKKKKLTDLTHEEAGTANLTPQQYDVWANAQKPSANPFG